GRPGARGDYGTTAFEQSQGEPLSSRLYREIPDTAPDVRPAEDPNRPHVQLEQDLDTTPPTDSGTGPPPDAIAPPPHPPPHGARAAPPTTSKPPLIPSPPAVARAPKRRRSTSPTAEPGASPR